MLSRKNKMVFMETKNISKKKFQIKEISKKNSKNFSTTEILRKHSTEQISGKPQTFSQFYDEICPENRVEKFQT